MSAKVNSNKVKAPVSYVGGVPVQGEALSLPEEAVFQPKEFLTEQDKHALEMVKLKASLAVANAEKALAQNDTAKMSYDNLVLQLTFKYNLKEKDMITEQGEIIRKVENEVA